MKIKTPITASVIRPLGYDCHIIYDADRNALSANELQEVVNIVNTHEELLSATKIANDWIEGETNYTLEVVDSAIAKAEGKEMEGESYVGN